MPRFNAQRRKKYRFQIDGYLTYNTGGWLGISPVPPPADGDESWSPEGYFQVPEYMVAEEPEKIPEYPDETLARVTQGEATWVAEYHGAGWRDPNSQVPMNFASDSEIEILFIPEEH